MSTKTRIEKLEKKHGIRTDLWYFMVFVKKNETKESALNRTLMGKGIDRTQVGYVSYMSDEFGWEDERLNGYDGKVLDLRGGNSVKILMDEIDGTSSGLPV